METAEPLRLSRDLLSRKVADLLRRRILTGRLISGTRLVEDDLAAEIGTSRSPVRDAFAVLAAEGLLTVTPGRGTYVKGLTPQRIRQLYDIRAVLESRAVELATEHSDPAPAARLRVLARRMLAAAESGDVGAFVHLDLRIHREVWSLTGNEYLINVMELLRGPWMGLMGLAAMDAAELTRVARLHLRLVEAVASGDRSEALAAIQENMDTSRRDAIAALEARSKINLATREVSQRQPPP